MTYRGVDAEAPGVTCPSPNVRSVFTLPGMTYAWLGYVWTHVRAASMHACGHVRHAPWRSELTILLACFIPCVACLVAVCFGGPPLGSGTVHATLGSSFSTHAPLCSARTQATATILLSAPKPHRRTRAPAHPY